MEFEKYLNQLDDIAKLMEDYDSFKINRNLIYNKLIEFAIEIDDLNNWTDKIESIRYLFRINEIEILFNGYENPIFIPLYERIHLIVGIGLLNLGNIR